MSDYQYPLTEQNIVINVYPVELVNVKRLIVEEEQVGPATEEILRKSANNWSKAMSIGMERELSLALKLAGSERDSHQIIFNNDGLINEFSHLKTVEDIEAFSQKYGLLGVNPPDSEQVNSKSTLVWATLQPYFIYNTYGFSVFEPIDLWFWHINEVRQILKLYDVVRKDSSDDRVDDLIEIKEHSGRFGSLAEDRTTMDRYFVYWTEGELILMLPKDMEERSMLEIGQYTLSKVLASHISGGIHLGVGELIRNPSTKGFKVSERRYTPYLLAAIYYDLWQKINDDKNIFICGNKSCGLPFIKSRRKKYCSDACKQEAYRERKRKGSDTL
ncbi:hypothetical protein [Halobacillus sp. BBL2006]|uniref:hypothetical protein n=1 Tax=Halobacillus sp. BBL2006 TaxID=1543706 RepID=UPI000541F319|nr:hypothetical protein [Halobacillus sp. BBL2006]KHE71931.1 hypothetical protein LD39_07190 [Halobacillus sp. BBL2006]